MFPPPGSHFAFAALEILVARMTLQIHSNESSDFISFRIFGLAVRGLVREVGREFQVLFSLKRGQHFATLFRSPFYSQTCFYSHDIVSLLYLVITEDTAERSDSARPMLQIHPKSCIQKSIRFCVSTQTNILFCDHSRTPFLFSKRMFADAD
jgi:hypothetical protein